MAAAKLDNPGPSERLRELGTGQAKTPKHRHRTQWSTHRSLRRESGDALEGLDLWGRVGIA